MPDEASPAAPAAPADAAPGNLFSAAPAAAPAAVPVAPVAPTSYSLPDSFKNTPSLQAFAGFEAKDLIHVPKELLEKLGGAYTETKSLVGKKFQAPSETSTPEEVASWRKTVGAPDSPEGYGELRPEDFPEDQWDKETAGELAKLAHRHHIPAAALKDIVGLHSKAVTAGIAKLEAGEAESRQAEITTLKQAWGADFDANVHAAKTFATVLGLDPLNDPVFRSSSAVMAMARGAKLIMGDKAIAAAAPGMSGGIESRIQGIQSSPEYLGERGEQAQAAAQAQLHALYSARAA